MAHAGYYFSRFFFSICRMVMSLLSWAAGEVRIASAWICGLFVIGVLALLFLFDPDRDSALDFLKAAAALGQLVVVCYFFAFVLRLQIRAARI